MTPFDIPNTFTAAIFALGVIGLALSLLLAFVVYRATRGRNQTRIAAFLILVGFVLIATLVGAEVGSVSVLAGVFVIILRAIGGRKA